MQQEYHCLKFENNEDRGKRKQSLGGLEVLMASTRRRESSGDQTELTGSDQQELPVDICCPERPTWTAFRVATGPETRLDMIYLGQCCLPVIGTLDGRR